MFIRKNFDITVVVIFIFFAGFARAHTHTHIGRNPNGIWGDADDNQLWIFATADNPQWNTIKMLPSGEYIGKKQIYIAELDCWHSAHPESGLYQLDFNNESNQPDWRISLKRISFSEPVNFWMQDEATTMEILTYDGATFAFEPPCWDPELPNGYGGSGAWHFHNHTEFLALADGPGQVFTATFTVIDTGLTGFTESMPYTLTFITIPEPDCGLLILTSLFVVSGYKRNGKRKP